MNDAFKRYKERQARFQDAGLAVRPSLPVAPVAAPWPANLFALRLWLPHRVTHSGTAALRLQMQGPMPGHAEYVPCRIVQYKYMPAL